LHCGGLPAVALVGRTIKAGHNSLKSKKTRSRKGGRPFDKLRAGHGAPLIDQSTYYFHLLHGIAGVTCHPACLLLECGKGVVCAMRVSLLL
jgi:hypothetical protein